ncbi:peptidase [Escherichia coli]|uniref:Peptidase n=1 Tax=Escherichia coli TaxID=562 RepID=A0A377E1X7_ECOLX|nr:peptidase [Escherichia coli]
MSWPINLRPVHLITRRIVYQIKSSITFPILPGKAVSIIRYRPQQDSSSPFNPARLNPVSGKVSPHNGIDYSMPMNTKIVSVIDGKITRAEYNSTMGYFVEVREKPVLKLAISTSIKYSLLKGPGLHGEVLLRYPVTADVHPVLICITSWSSITTLLTLWRSGQRHPLITNSNSMPLRMSRDYERYLD